MNTYENENELEYTTQPEKKSPYEDSPYERVYTEPEGQTTVRSKTKKPKRVRRIVLTALLLVVCCVLSGIAVNEVWQDRMARMENAMNEKFAALQQLYAESNSANPGTQHPAVGPMTPGQVYSKNVDAVVAVNARYETANGVAQGAGSGFVISADGYVVTNYHVIEKATQLSVIPHGKSAVKAEVVGYDVTNDVALLKIEGEDLPFVTFGSSDNLVVGDQVAAIGNPLGELTASLTVGYISAKDRVVSTDGTVINMLQTDAAINSGNSGGPLFNMNGEVIGIITAKYSGSSNSGVSIEGLGFAIPMDDISGIVSDLKQFGYVTGAYLGVYVRDVEVSAQSYGLPAGAYIEDAVKGFCAYEAGIRTGDIIVNLGGYDVDSVTTLTRVLRRFKAGETISATVYRSGKQEYVTITLDEKPVEKEDSTTDATTPVPNEGNKNWFDFFMPFFGIG